MVNETKNQIRQITVLPVLVGLANLTLAYLLLIFVFETSASFKFSLLLALIPIIVVSGFLLAVATMLRLPFKAKRAVCLAISILMTVPIYISAVGHEEQYVVAEMSLRNGLECRIYRDKFSDPSPGLRYCEISRDGEILVPMTNYDQSGDYPCRLRDVYARNDTIVGIIEDSGQAVRLIVIYDENTGESWPRLRDDEVSYDPAVLSKWMAIFSRLKRENPDIPVPNYFSGRYQPTSLPVSSAVDQHRR